MYIEYMSHKTNFFVMHGVLSIPMFLENKWFNIININEVHHSTNFEAHLSKIVATLALGSRPKQRVARLRAKRETREHFTCSRECKECDEPSHSQVNSHVGSWSPERTPEFSERHCKG
jgi:hypothetical protein